MVERRFTSEQADQILARAAELEHEKKDAVLSATDLELIATETGLEPAHVRRAISELDRPRVSVWLGAPAHVELMEEVETPGRFDADEVRWIRRGPGATRISITRREGKTRFKVRARFTHLIGGLYGGIGGGAGFGIGGPLFALVLVKSGSFALATFCGLSAVLLAVAGARAIFGAIVRARVRRLEEVLRELVSAG